LEIAKESKFTPTSKIIGLNFSINTTLKRNLVTLQFPNDDYDIWVSMVRTVAGKLKALPEYRPRRTKNTVTWFLKEPGLVLETPALRIIKPGINRNGDVIMEKVNKFEIKTLIAAIKAISTGSNFQGGYRGNNPIFQKQYDKIKKLGLCFRCKIYIYINTP
jgi:hypothetical protein